MKAPKRDRPDLPKGYIARTPKGMLSWRAASQILRDGRYVWLATTNADGSPHLIQQWGVWIGNTLYFDGSEKTRWARNLAARPLLAFGTQVADRAVYGGATVDVVRGLDVTLAQQVAKEYVRKYGRAFKYRPKPEQFEKGNVHRARPVKLIAFDVKEFNTSAARFTF